MKVLIVDDNADIRGMIRFILEKQGHTVAGEAEDGPGALKAFKELRPEVMLLDVIMPGMSGLDVLEEIRKIDPGAAVIMVTALEQDALNRRLLRMGAAGMIFKPFRADEFEKAFRALPKKKPAAEDKNETLTRLASDGLGRCMLKIADASTWAWELCEVRVFSGKIADAVQLADPGPDAASVNITVQEGSRLAAAMIFRDEDIGYISSCFVGDTLFQTGGIKRLDERLVIEIGNIILNALLTPLLNTLKLAVLPSLPMLIKGGPAAVEAGLGACVAPKPEYRMIYAVIAMLRNGRIGKAAVLAVLPEELAAEVERAAVP